jgi:hypothetical protein
MTSMADRSIRPTRRLSARPLPLLTDEMVLPVGNRKITGYRLLSLAHLAHEREHVGVEDAVGRY